MRPLSASKTKKLFSSNPYSEKSYGNLFIMGKDTSAHGIHKETVCVIARDEFSGYVSCMPDTNKDHKSIAVGLRHHFGPQIDDVKSCKGFLIYSDSAPEYKNVCVN